MGATFQHFDRENRGDGEKGVLMSGVFTFYNEALWGVRGNISDVRMRLWVRKA